MFWKEYLQNFSSAKTPGFDLKFYPPMDEINLEMAEKKLEDKFPQELRNLYLETNGIGLVLLTGNQEGESLIGYLIWPLEQVITENLNFRSDVVLKKIYRSFNNFLFFSDAGNGDQYAYLIKNDNSEANNQIFRWDHEDDARRFFAGSLQEFFNSY